jgi:hypothetical protein
MTNETIKIRRQNNHSSYSLKKDGDVFIAIERVELTDRDRNYEERRQNIYITEFPDSKVAARLASTDIF